jgi:hypothetical protein
VIDIVLTFNMGTDKESILASPIGQPMATVSLSPLQLSLTDVLRSTLDILQLLW